MNEKLELATEELKRIDHLIYVTLKYTRTVDVFLSIVERMINAYEFIVESLVEKAKQDKIIESYPDQPLLKAELVQKHYEQKKVQDHLVKYLIFRKARRVEYEKFNEFRRHVTMKAEVDGEPFEITIDTITEDYHNLKSFIEYLQRTIFEPQK